VRAERLVHGSDQQSCSHASADLGQGQLGAGQVRPGARAGCRGCGARRGSCRVRRRAGVSAG